MGAGWCSATAADATTQTHLLPPNLLKLFAPRPPLPYLKPLGRDPDVPLRTLANRLTPLSVSETLARVREEKAENEAKHAEEGTAGEASEQGLVLILGEEARKVRKEEKAKQRALALEHGIESCTSTAAVPLTGLTLPDDRRPRRGSRDCWRSVQDPLCRSTAPRLHRGRSATGIRDLRLSGTSQARHGQGGQVERLRLHRLRTRKGYERFVASYLSLRTHTLTRYDTTAAYKNAEGLKLLNKRLLIDVERGRTVKDWKPRRLGGGLGGRPKPIIAGAFITSVMRDRC